MVNVTEFICINIYTLFAFMLHSYAYNVGLSLCVIY